MDNHPSTNINGSLPHWKDFERGDNAESDGTFTGRQTEIGRLLYPDQVGSSGTVFGLQEVTRLRAFPLICTTDDANVAFPAGSVLVTSTSSVTYLRQQMYSGSTLLGSGVTQGLIDGQALWKMFGRRIDIFGIQPGSSGTITIERAANWIDYTTTPTDTVWSLSVDSANGSNQSFIVPVIEGPALSCDPSSGAFSAMKLYFRSSWTGGYPVSQHITELNSLSDIDNCAVVPSALPAGYTLNPNAFESAFGAAHYLPSPRWRAYPYGCPGISPLNRGFVTRSLVNGLVQRFGQPEVSTIANFQVKPCIQKDGQLYQHTLFPACPTVKVDSDSQGISTNLTGPSDTVLTSGFKLAGIAPGWRNITVHAFGAGHAPDPGATITWTSLEVQIGHLPGWIQHTSEPESDFIVDSTVTWATEASAAGSGSTLLTGPINPSPDNIQNAYVYYRMRLTFNKPSPDGSYFFVSAEVLLSRRCDIPLLWPAAGVNEFALGGYKTGLLSTPVISQDIVFALAGSSSEAFPGGVTPNTRGALVGFILPSSGLWRILDAYNGATYRATAGEYEQHFLRRTTQVGRAGCRFWGVVDNLPASSTLTLQSRTMTVTDVPSGAGLSLAYAHVTDDGWIFLKITAASAGTYTISLSGKPNYRMEAGGTSTGFGVSVFIAASLTEQSCADPDFIASQEWWNGGSLAGTITATPPASPSSNDRYIVGDGATGLWAGEDGNIAVFSSLSHQWVFLRPNYSMYGAAASSGGVHYWRNPGDTAWTSSSGTLLSMDVVVETPGDFYLRLGKNDPDGVTQNDMIISQFANDIYSPVISWTFVP